MNSGALSPTAMLLLDQLERCITEHRAPFRRIAYARRFNVTIAEIVEAETELYNRGLLGFDLRPGTTTHGSRMRYWLPHMSAKTPWRTGDIELSPLDGGCVVERAS